MSPAYTVGVDIGSTSIKAVIYNEKGEFVTGASRPMPLRYVDPDHPEWCVWEPEEVWNNARESLCEAVSNIDDKENIKGITCTGFAFDGVPLDKDGNALYPFISWHCPRTQEIFDELREAFGARDIFYKTGKTPWVIDPIYRLHWLKRNEPEVFEKIDKYVLIVDYIVFRLTGRVVSDYTMALSTSVFDVHSLSWDRDEIERMDLPQHIWCEAIPSGTVAGTITKEIAGQTSLDPKTIVTMGGHDFTTAAIAIGAIEEGVVVDIAGTWEMIYAPSRTVELSDPLMNSGFYVDVHSQKGLYVYVCSMVSGDMTEWLRENLYFGAGTESGKVWEEIAATAAEAALGSKGCCFLPLFSGSIADPKDRGAFVGMSNQTGRVEMTRAVFEGLNYQIRNTFEIMDDLVPVRRERMVVTGGASKNTFWMQNKADITGIELEVPDVYEITTLGGALAAMIGAGIYSDAKQAYEATKKPCKKYVPDMKKYEQYTQYYEKVFLKLQNTLNEINHLIYELK